MDKNCVTHNNRSYLKRFLCKYKVLIILLISIPIILSICCYFSLPYFNEAGSSAWLGFWGGYLGSSIMAAITLYVLDRQLTQNHNENVCNAVMQIATLTNNEETAQIAKLSDALVDFQTSFDFLTINQIVERMLKGKFLSSDVNILNNLIRDVDCKGLKIDILLKPIPKSEYIIEYDKIYNQLYNGYGCLIGDLISFIDLMKDLPTDKQIAKTYILQLIEDNKAIDANIFKNNVPGFVKPKSIFEIIEEKQYFDNIEKYSSEIIKERLLQPLNVESELKEKLKTTIINLIDHEYKCINENFNDKMKVYEEAGIDLDR